MTDDEAHAHAQRAATLWGEVAAPPRLIAKRENIVFEIRLSDGRHGALRLHRAGYQTDAAIRSELLWTEALAEAGFPCPRPLRNRAGQMLGCPTFDPRASVTGWIDAAPLATPDPKLFHQLGRLVRRLHDLGTAYRPPSGFQRPCWSADALVGEAPLWGQFWRNRCLSPAEADTLRAARDLAREELAHLPAPNCLIHADLLPDNILVGPEGLVLIDFDDGGWGYPLYDLGTALVSHHDAPEHDSLAEALADGYGLTPAERATLPFYTMLRACASAGWIMSRAAPDDPRQRSHAERALACARAVLR